MCTRKKHETVCSNSHSDDTTEHANACLAALLVRRESEIDSNENQSLYDSPQKRPKFNIKDEVKSILRSPANNEGLKELKISHYKAERENNFFNKLGSYASSSVSTFNAVNSSIMFVELNNKSFEKSLPCSPVQTTVNNSDKSSITEMEENIPFATLEANVSYDLFLPTTDKTCASSESTYYDEDNSVLSFNGESKQMPFQYLPVNCDMDVSRKDKQYKITLETCNDNDEIITQNSDKLTYEQRTITQDSINKTQTQDSINKTQTQDSINKTQTQESLNLLSDADLFDQEKSYIIGEKKRKIMVTLKSLISEIKQSIGKKRTHSFELRTISWKNCTLQDSRLQLKPNGQAATRFIIANRNKNKHILITNLLKKILYMMKQNLTCTKRQIFYQLFETVKSSSVTDTAIRDISVLLGVGPWDFNIIHTSKGLVYGKMDIHLINNTIIKCDTKGGTLIPQTIGDIKNLRTNAQFILIVEKDTIFQELLNENLNSIFEEQFILITGKGYPDTNTRLFVKKLHNLLAIPIYILTDADPYGIDIMFTYRYGSLSFSHISEELAVPDSKWLGIFPSDIELFGIPNIPMNEKEIKKIDSILKRPYVNINRRFSKELNILKKNNKKSEIDGLIKDDWYLSKTYLSIKINKKDLV